MIGFGRSVNLVHPHGTVLYMTWVNYILHREAQYWFLALRLAAQCSICDVQSIQDRRGATGKNRTLIIIICQHQHMLSPFLPTLYFFPSGPPLFDHYGKSRHHTSWTRITFGHLPACFIPSFNALPSNYVRRLYSVYVICCWSCFLVEKSLHAHARLLMGEMTTCEDYTRRGQL
jgi:hypothetical protein